MERTVARQILLIAACAAFAAQLLLPPLFVRNASAAELGLRALVCTDDETLSLSASAAARDLVGASRHDRGQVGGGFCLLCQAPAAMAATAPDGALIRFQHLSFSALPLVVLHVALSAVGPPLGGRAPPRA